LHTTNTDNDLEMKRVAEQKKFVQNGQGLWLFGDVAGQPKPIYDTEGISRSKHAIDRHTIHFTH
jgi:hypothetical protein